MNEKFTPPAKAKTPDHMESAKTLFYPEREYGRAVRTLERVSKHILWKYALVGGIANRTLYPEWGEMNRARPFNDLDLVLLPTPADEGTAPLDKSIKDDYFITFINPDAKYFGMIDKQEYVNVDIFTSARDLATQEMELNGKLYTVLTSEERYLSMARDIYQTLTKGRHLDPKHVEFLAYLVDKVDQEKLHGIWEQEAVIIKRKEEYPFATFEEYLGLIDHLIESKPELIEEKVPGTKKLVYDPPRTEAFGITVENEADFMAAFAKKREIMGQ